MGLTTQYFAVPSVELDAYLKQGIDIDKFLTQSASCADFERLNHVDIGKAWEGLLFLLTGHTIAGLDDVLRLADMRYYAYAVLGFEDIPTKKSFKKTGWFNRIAIEVLGSIFARASKLQDIRVFRYLTNEQVDEVSQRLEKLDISMRLDMADFTKFEQAAVYPQIWDDKTEHLADYLNDAFTALLEFYQVTASQNHAVIIEVF